MTKQQFDNAKIGNFVRSNLTQRVYEIKSKDNDGFVFFNYPTEINYNYVFFKIIAKPKYLYDI